MRRKHAKTRTGAAAPGQGVTPEENAAHPDTVRGFALAGQFGSRKGAR